MRKILLTEIRKVFLFQVVPSLSFRLLYSNNDMSVDLNQAYNLIQIVCNNPKRIEGGANFAKYVRDFHFLKKYRFSN